MIQKIPIFINNRNRLTSLKLLLQWCSNVENLFPIILDMDSVYPPLLDFYKEIKSDVQIVPLKNLGKRALWLTQLFVDYPWFIYTDSDIVPENVPYDAIDMFKETMEKHPEVDKAGFNLEIDKIPLSYTLRDHIHEVHKTRRYTATRWAKDPRYFCGNGIIDSTFALHELERTKRLICFQGFHLRSDYPYVAIHWPWMVPMDNEEEIYYLQHIENGFGHYSQKAKKLL